MSSPAGVIVRVRYSLTLSPFRGTWAFSLRFAHKVISRRAPENWLFLFLDSLEARKTAVTFSFDIARFSTPCTHYLGTASNIWEGYLGDEAFGGFGEMLKSFVCTWIKRVYKVKKRFPNMLSVVGNFRTAGILVERAIDPALWIFRTPSGLRLAAFRRVEILHPSEDGEAL